MKISRLHAVLSTYKVCIYHSTFFTLNPPLSSTLPLHTIRPLRWCSTPLWSKSLQMDSMLWSRDCWMKSFILLPLCLVSLSIMSYQTTRLMWKRCVCTHWSDNNTI